MGLIDGAIIGGVIGAVVGGYMAWQMKAWQQKFLTAVDAGDRVGAERLIAKHAPAIKRAKSFPLAKVVPQRHRVLGLWLLGNLDEVRNELAIHGGTGGPAYLMNVHLMGLLALANEAAATGGDTAAVVREIQDTAARVVKDSNALQKLLKDYAAMIASVAVGLTGEPVDEVAAKKLFDKQHGETLLSRIVLLRALVLAAERAGKPASLLNQKLAQLTKRFAPPAAAAN